MDNTRWVLACAGVCLCAAWSCAGGDEARLPPSPQGDEETTFEPPPPVELPPIPTACDAVRSLLVEVDVQAADPAYMTVVADELLVLFTDPRTISRQVHAVRKTGGLARRLTIVEPGVIGFWVEGRDLLFATMHGLFQQPLEGGPALQVLTAGGVGLRATVVDASHLYWLADEGEKGESLRLRRVSREDGLVEELWQMSAPTGKTWTDCDCALLDGQQQLFVAASGLEAQVIVAVDKSTGGAREILRRTTLDVPELLVATERAVYFPHPLMGSLFELRYGRDVPEIVPLSGVSEQYWVHAARANQGRLLLGVVSLFDDASWRPLVGEVAEGGGEVAVMGCLDAISPSIPATGETIEAVAGDGTAVYAWAVDRFVTRKARLYRFEQEVR